MLSILSPVITGSAVVGKVNGEAQILTPCKIYIP